MDNDKENIIEKLNNIEYMEENEYINYLHDEVYMDLHQLIIWSVIFRMK